MGGPYMPCLAMASSWRDLTRQPSRGAGGQHLKLAASERTEAMFFQSGKRGSAETADQELDLVIRENAEIVINGDRRTLPVFGHGAEVPNGRLQS
jgi:hypothetical protein